jgi:membrane protease YdiL (CAAX protease family)
LGKRLIAFFGFGWGNLLQASVFGLVHLGCLWGESYPHPVQLNCVIFATVMGWVFGYLNERLGNGSILPSWWMHGLINLGVSVSFGLVLR